jgi:hypothetical protein
MPLGPPLTTNHQSVDIATIHRMMQKPIMVVQEKSTRLSIIRLLLEDLSRLLPIFVKNNLH